MKMAMEMKKQMNKKMRRKREMQGGWGNEDGYEESRDE